jgi:hypothetical protein
MRRGEGFLGYVFGLVWAMVLVPIAAGIKGLSGSQWLLLVPTILLLGFFLGWLTDQYRRLDVVGAQRHAWRTLSQRQAWYKRIRLLSAWLFFQTVLVFAIVTAVRGDAALLVPLGLATGAAGAAIIALAWSFNSGQLEQDGWRW